MHSKDYIASGILQLYAAGGLTEAEKEEVEQFAAASPEIRAALDEACIAMEEYARLYAVPPRPELRDKILNQLNSTFPPEINDQDKFILPPTTETTIKEVYTYKWLFAASVALFLLTGFLSFRFYSNWQEAESKIQNLLASEQRLAQDYRTVSNKIEQQEKALAVLRNPDLNVVKLQGVEAHPEASLVVYWNSKQEQVYIDKINLPTPPAGKQYQLWALDNGNPVDAGMITLTEGTTELQQMKKVASAQAFAVTLEPVGGSIIPTLEQLTAIGKVGS